MSSPSNLSSIVNLEFLRKEAKSLLKLCRSRDAGALARIRAGLPRLAELDGERLAIEIKLADIQHALAQERGFANWGELKRQDSIKALPDFSQAGSDGIALPEGFSPWRWCVSYTVRPEILSPLIYGREYRIIARALRSSEGFTTYAALYDRATAIADSRVAQLKCAAEGTFLHKRILNHGWFRYNATNIPTAFLTIGIVCLKQGDPIPQGENAPTREELAVPGGMTPDNFTVPAAAINKSIEESYSVGDVRDPLDAGPGIFMFSYGEYAQACDGIDYKPFVERAERLTKLHLPFLYGLDSNSPSAKHAKIVRREWFCATNPDIAVVHVYVQT
jgi:hypothetical protein